MCLIADPANVELRIGMGHAHEFEWEFVGCGYGLSGEEFLGLGGKDVFLEGG